MKKLFTKTLLIAIVALISATTASAFSVRLSDKYEVAGYKMKAFYNLSSNTTGIMPTSGDFRYRDANYGMFNYGSGNRGADLAISVAKDDIIVFDFNDTQNRSVTVNSVTNGTKVATLSGTYPTFSISANADNINVNVGRGGNIMSIVVMEKDEQASTADYTINYKFGDTTVKTVNDNDVVGKTVTADASFIKNGVKYIVTSETRSMTITNGTNVLNVDVRLAETFNYTVVAKYGESTLKPIASGTGVEGETINFGYTKYILDGTQLYSAAKQTTNPWWGKSMLLNENNKTEQITYANPIENVVFYAEAENIEGATATSAANAEIRCSGKAGGYAGDPLTFTTLPTGKYILSTSVWGNKGVVINFLAGSQNILAVETQGYIVDINSAEFTCYGNTEISFSGTDNNHPVDYIYIVRTGDAPTAVSVEATEKGASYVTPCALDFTGSNIKAYVATAVSGTAITLAEVTKVPAGQAILVAGETSDVNVIASAEAPAVNLFKSGAKTVGAGENVFALSKADGQFHIVAEGVEIPEGKAYIVANTSAKTLTLDFTGEATGINSVATAKQNGSAYNLMGQKVSANAKGIVIINGKKYNK